MLIDEQTDALERAISLQELVSETVALEDDPSSLRGRCPSHPDPSRGLYVKSARFHCFSCGIGGDIVDWVRLVARVGRSEAFAKLVERLADSTKHER